MQHFFLALFCLVFISWVAAFLIQDLNYIKKESRAFHYCSLVRLISVVMLWILILGSWIHDLFK